jgi:hypothetical protein
MSIRSSLQLVHLSCRRAEVSIPLSSEGEYLMKAAVIAVATAVLSAGAAQASERVSDVDYLQANRCRGLAARIDGVVDPAALDAFVKAARGARSAYIVERGDAEFDRARREARSEDRRARLTAELTGPCQAYLGRASNIANKGGDPGVVRQ